MGFWEQQRVKFREEIQNKYRKTGGKNPEINCRKAISELAKRHSWRNFEYFWMDLQKEFSEKLWKHIGKLLEDISGGTPTDISGKTWAEIQEGNESTPRNLEKKEVFGNVLVKFLKSLQFLDISKFVLFFEWSTFKNSYGKLREFYFALWVDTLF